MARKKQLVQGDIEMDLTPMIDMVFLLIIFFILAGRITSELRAESISVPPSNTAEENDNDPDFQRVIIEAFGTTQSVASGEPANRLRWDGQPPQGEWARGIDDMTAYKALRTYMDQVYLHADDWKTQDGLKLKKVVVEIRADADTEYRIIQEIMQVLSDTIDPFNNMLPKKVMPESMKPFVNLLFTTRNPSDRRE